MVLDMTGPVGFAGVEAKKGIDLAVKEANDANALGGGTKIAVNIQDAASDPEAGRVADPEGHRATTASR